MPSFYPETTIYACSTGIDDYNKPYFESNSAAASYCMARAKLSFSDYSYQRADERQYCAVYANFNELEECDTLIWQNADFSSFWFIANITNLEWKNPNCVWIWFKVDAYMTFCGNIDWSSSYCLVEREHVTNDWSGGVPNFSNIGLPEGIGVGPVRRSSSNQFYKTPNVIAITSPYDQSGQKTAEGAMQNGVFTGLNTYMFQNAARANNYLQNILDSDEADIQNVVSAITIPQDYIDGRSETVDAPTPPWTTWAGTIYNAKTFSGEFCVLQIDSLVGTAKHYRPEDFLVPSNITFTEKDSFSAGVGGVIVRPNSYMTANPTEDAFIINEFPEGSMVGDTYAQWKSSLGGYAIANTFLSCITTAGTTVTQAVSASQQKNPVSSVAGIGGAVISGVGSIGQDVMSTIAQFAEQKKYGTAIIGSMKATANLAVGLDAYGYAISWLVPQETQMYAVDDFFSRFGYLVNRLKVPNRNTRAHWNYVKCSESHVQGDMPYSYRVQIEAMLNSGVTFWSEGTTIGDYSDKAGNMG